MADRILRRAAPKQSGVVLITGLIFVVILTMIVLAVLRSGSLEERMAANARNRQLALQAAEAVLRDAEDASFSTAVAPFDPFTPTSFSTTCTNGYCTKPAGGSTPRWKTIDWDSTGATRSFAADTANLTSTLVASQPRYIIEIASTPVISPSAGGGLCPSIVYRLTARGLGLDASEVFVQTMYRSLPNLC